MAEPVVIVAYDPRWPTVFEELRDRAAAVLGTLALRIEHVGSTSVPGIPAKPIIDLDVVIADRADLPAVVRLLAGLGYVHVGDQGITGREAFTAPADLPRHHLYVCSANAEELRKHLAFRDFLRSHADVAQQYGALKIALALRYADDRAGYTEAKTGFVAEVLRMASVSR